MILSVVIWVAFYEEGIQKLVPLYDKCLNNGGKYVEEQFEEYRI